MNTNTVELQLVTLGALWSNRVWASISVEVNYYSLVTDLIVVLNSQLITSSVFRGLTSR